MAAAVPLVWDADTPAAVRLVADVLRAAPPGNAGWTIPIDPLLRVLLAANRRQRFDPGDAASVDTITKTATSACESAAPCRRSGSGQIVRRPDSLARQDLLREALLRLRSGRYGNRSDKQRQDHT